MSQVSFVIYASAFSAPCSTVEQVSQLYYYLNLPLISAHALVDLYLALHEKSVSRVHDHHVNHVQSCKSCKNAQLERHAS